MHSGPQGRCTREGLHLFTSRYFSFIASDKAVPAADISSFSLRIARHFRHSRLVRMKIRKQFRFYGPEIWL